MKRVLVVGAGPGGAAAALALRQAGLEVAVLDAARFPRDKVCAGGLSVAAQRQLAMLGVLERVMAEAHLFARLRLVGPGGETWALARARSVVLPRWRFDGLLVEAAVRRGALLEQGVRATGLLRHGSRVFGVETSAGPREADLVVIAAGVHAARRGAALAPPASPPACRFAVQRRFDGPFFDPAMMEMIYARELLPGYGWVFPESDVRANVGVILADNHPGRKHPGQVLDAFLETHLGTRMRRAVPVDAIHGHPVASRAAVPDLATPGVLWVGEAAGLTSAATGEGIWHALRSGREAAAAIIETGGDAHQTAQRYCWRVRRAFSVPLLAAAAFSRTARTAVFPAAVRLANRPPLDILSRLLLERV